MHFTYTAHKKQNDGNAGKYAPGVHEKGKDGGVTMKKAGSVCSCVRVKLGTCAMKRRSVKAKLLSAASGILAAAEACCESDL